MADYTLSDGDNVLISSNTTVEDFIYEGGKISVKPNVAFFMTGDFVFRPTSSDDAVGHLFGSLVARASIETGYNGVFTGFTIYDIMPDTTPLFFPAIVFDMADSEERITADFFGGDWMESSQVMCELAFKMDKYLRVGTASVGKKELAEHYLWYMRQKLNDIVYKSEYIKVGNVDIDTSVHEPLAPNQTLYGFSMEIGFDFMKEL
jgi:hypothetical protein